MFNFLLDVYNVGVSNSTTSSDGIPDGIAKGLDSDIPTFILGMLTAFGIVLFIKLIKYFVKLIKEDNEWRNQKENLTKSDE